MNFIPKHEHRVRELLLTLHCQNKKDMYLYYDYLKGIFTLKETETCECVFATYGRDDRVGWEEGNNPSIKKGPFTIDIRTNFYPKALHQEFLFVNIYVNGVLLLPLSKACRKADVLYYFNEHQITFLQYGAGQNREKDPSTIVQIREHISWESALEEICNICNNYEKWIVDETRSLLSTLLENNKTSSYDISTLLELVRVYDEIAPNVIPVYRNFVDLRCIGAMKDVLDVVESHKDMDIHNRVVKAKNGNVIWEYIKDYYLTK